MRLGYAIKVLHVLLLPVASENCHNVRIFVA